jgi:hypothetical protein
MAKTSAERQKAYRKRSPDAGENGHRRINTWVTSGAALALNRLALRYGVTKREMLERLILEADQDVTATIEPDTPQWDAYFKAAVTP